VTRLISLEGPVNVRDVGDGRRVRAGRIFRGDNLDGLSPGDATVLFDGLGIRTVVDLRSETEAARAVLPAGVRWINAPVITAHGLANPMLDPDATDLGDYYRHYLADGPELVVAALRAVIDASAQPVLVHCAAGKDRTGVVCAILQSLLEVPTTEIVADYAFTATRMELIIGRLVAAHPEYADRMRGTSSPLMTATPETMERFLDGFDVGAWCNANGISDAEVARLRERLLL
jgi:protein tyrosine/serine phosphatase